MTVEPSPGERYCLEPLGVHHDRKLFRSGIDELDLYLRQRADQDGRRKVASVFVGVQKTSGELPSRDGTAGSQHWVAAVTASC